MSDRLSNAIWVILLTPAWIVVDIYIMIRYRNVRQ
jgi:hypothetical protein